MADFFQMEVEQRVSQPPVLIDRICLVCGDKARGMNFDVLTCMSCKAFFRRNALRRSVSLNYPDWSLSGAGEPFLSST